MLIAKYKAQSQQKANKELGPRQSSQTKACSVKAELNLSWQFAVPPRVPAHCLLIKNDDVMQRS